ncbi:restriction endonuclease, partial [Mycoplasmopsis pullorum]
MKELMTNNWKYFYLKDLFEIDKGERLTKEDSIEGSVPFITAGEGNLGLDRYIGNNVKYFSNSITLDMFGFAFYRDYIFSCDDNIIVLKLKSNSSKYVYNFISTIINRDKYKISY